MGYKGDYKSLGGLENTRIGYYTIEKAINYLDSATVADIDSMKEHIKALVIFVSESVRFRNISRGIKKLVEEREDIT